MWIYKGSFKESFRVKEFSEVPVNATNKCASANSECSKSGLANNIKVGLDDMKTFILLLNDKLKGSNMKLITLVVIDRT